MLFPSCLLGGAACVSLLLPVAAMEYIKNTTVTGYFLQDDPTTNASTFDYVRHAFFSSFPSLPIARGAGD
jgi:hypothetical protein